MCAKLQQTADPAAILELTMRKLKGQKTLILCSRKCSAFRWGPEKLLGIQRPLEKNF
ncbi:hypothetical protein lerEdw1_003453 [Lerista edwardsae]|nr:hypothetical protein lerEdw1_003453 [Lerista edwardsae]